MFTAIRLLAICAVLAVALGGAASGAKAGISTAGGDDNVFDKLKDTFKSLTKDNSIGASVAGVESNGLEGLNIKVAAPFKFMDYVVGFRGRVSDVNSLSPDSLFASKNFDGVDVDVDYDFDSQQVAAEARWSSDNIALKAKGNSNDYLTNVCATVKHTQSGESRDLHTKLCAAYETLTGKVSATLGLAADDVAASLKYDTDKQEPVVGLAYKLNEHTLSPSFNVKTGEVGYSYGRKLSNGALDVDVHPGDSVDVEWTDNASSGAWKTKVNYPLGGGSTKVSFNREWDL